MTALKVARIPEELAAMLLPIAKRAVGRAPGLDNAWHERFWRERLVACLQPWQYPDAGPSVKTALQRVSRAQLLLEDEQELMAYMLLLPEEVPDE